MNHDFPPPLHATSLGKKIGVRLIDDHAVVRQGLQMFIEMQNEED
jgi:hypothetical protein